jgi:hypothetical protein
MRFLRYSTSLLLNLVRMLMRIFSTSILMLGLCASACTVPASSPPPVYAQPAPAPMVPMPPQPSPMPQPMPEQPVAAPVAEVWDARGWVQLGEASVDGSRDRDKIKIGNAAGRFTKMTVVVLDSDLEMDDVAVNFVGGGKPFKPATRAVFRENTRTHVIDLPGADRSLASVQFRYRNLPGGGRARVQVWGFLVGGPAQPAPAPASTAMANAWSAEGWTLLGEQTVNGNRDKDKIMVGKDDGSFAKLTIVVLDSDLEMLDLEIKLGKGKSLTPDVRQVFNENSRSRVIDLPGDKRIIKWIEFRYRNLPGGGKARVQVWAK